MAVDYDPIWIALSDILVDDDSMFNMMKLHKLRNRWEWWDWMHCEYGAVPEGTVVSRKFGYGETAIKFPNRSSYMRYCLKWM